MTTPTAPRQTLHQLLEDAGTRSFVNNYTEQAVYHIADDGISRKEAIVLLAADLRRMQEEEVPEFTPVLRALEAAAGPQQVVAVETVGKLAPSATRTSLTHYFDDRYHSCPGARNYARDVTPELVQAEEVLKELENAASNIDLLAYNTKPANQSVIDNLSMFKMACYRLGRLATDAQFLLEDAGYETTPGCQDSLVIDDDHLARLQELTAAPKMEVEKLKELLTAAPEMEVEKLKELVEPLRPKQVPQPPSQKRAYDRAKRARDLPRRTYWTRETARRLGVQQLNA